MRRKAIWATAGVAGLAASALVVAQTERTVWDGVYTAEHASRGQQVYAKQCAACHGGQLGGGESAPPLTGDAFLGNWDGLTVGDLFERTRVSMPLRTPGKLSRQDYADVIALTLSANHFPDGKVELDKHAEVLKQIKIIATRPGQ
jgi:mono/diheme cytochrome c family protein